jgi:hypothetical protein
MEEKKKSIPAAKLASFEKPDAERNVQDRMAAAEVAMAIEPTYQELASRLPRAQQIRALELANDLSAAEARAKDTNSLRDQVNYAYWEVRAQAEQQSMMVEARRLLFEANKMIDVADIKGATEKYEAAFVRWDKVFRYYPVVMTEDVGEEVLKSINRYKKLIDEELDERFVLFEFMQFRRAYDADYLDFNVEKTLSDWRSRVEEFGSPEDFFNTPLAEAYGIQGDAKKQPDAPKQPAEVESEKVPSDQPATENPDPQPQPTKNVEVGAPSASSPTRPPRLENPE